MSLEHQISIFRPKWFINNHVTLKTGVKAAANTALPSQELITFKNYNTIENIHLKKIYWYFIILLFLLYCWSYNCSLLLSKYILLTWTELTLKLTFLLSIYFLKWNKTLKRTHIVEILPMPFTHISPSLSGKSFPVWDKHRDVYTSHCQSYVQMFLVQQLAIQFQWNKASH